MAAICFSSDRTPASRVYRSMTSASASSVIVEPVLADAVLAQLLGHEVTPGDGELLEPRVAGDLDDLHAVAQRRGDGVARRWPSR